MGNLKRPKEFEELPKSKLLFDSMCDVMPLSFIGKAQIEPYILEAIEIAKKDAWNAAIRWAADNARVMRDAEFEWDVDEQSILNGLIND